MKITKDEKRKKKRIRQSMKKKGDKRKVKWEKRGKKRRENSEMNYLFFMLFLLSLSSLIGGDITRYPTGRREIKLLLLVFELTVSSRQKSDR